MDSRYADFLKDVWNLREPGNITNVELSMSRSVAEIAYNFQDVAMPGRDSIFSFYVPEGTLKLEYVLLNIYFPGFQVGDYPDNSEIIYIPALHKGTLNYWGGSFYEFGQAYHQAGTGATGSDYGWYRAYQKFNISSLRGFKLTTCEMRWLLASKGFAGSGANAQHSMILQAIDDYGNLDKNDWGAQDRINYGIVNVYTNDDGLVYTAETKTRVQALIDAGDNYAAFVFKSDTEPTDTANANNYRINEPLLYCELSEDTDQKVGLSINNSTEFGEMLSSYSDDVEGLDITNQFSGVGKKQIKFSSSPRMRRFEAIIRMGLRT